MTADARIQFSGGRAVPGVHPSMRAELSKPKHSPELHWFKNSFGWVGFAAFVSKQFFDVPPSESVPPSSPVAPLELVDGGGIGGREGATASSLEHAATIAGTNERTSTAMVFA